MTLVLTINGPETIWMLTDRRLSYPNLPPIDDAHKILCIETTDGVALLGYAGLGATVAGTQPSDWMSAVLRGRKLTIEASLDVIAGAVQRQIPKHLRTLPGLNWPMHHVLIPAFVDDQAHLYAVEVEIVPNRLSPEFRYRRYCVGNSIRPPRIAIAGSGLSYLVQDKAWIKNLLHLIRACDQQRITHNVVADHLADLNYRVHKGTANSTVGPRCVVVWRNRKKGVHSAGGAVRYYTGNVADKDFPALPELAVGMDIRALAEAHLNALIPPTFRGDEIKFDESQLKDEVSKIRNDPEEDLV